MNVFTFAFSVGNVFTTILYIVAVIGFVTFFTGKPNEAGQPKNHTTEINWRPWEAISASIFIYFFTQIAVGLTMYITLGLAGWNEARVTDWLTNAVLGQFTSALLIDVLAVALLLLFLKSRRATMKTIGLRGRPKLNDIGKAVVGYFIYMAIYFLIATLVDRFIPSIDLEQKQQIGYENVATVYLPLVFMSLVILPPILEELVMRGFLYTGLKSKLPRVVAVIITSGLFAVAHLQAGSGAPLLWVAAIDTFILSVVLIELKDRTGALWAPIFLHALKNFVAFLSIFVFHLV